jgi:hypothetical protein
VISAIGKDGQHVFHMLSGCRGRGRYRWISNISVGARQPLDEAGKIPRSQLRRHRRRANGSTVQRSIIRVLLILAMLFGGVAVPALASSQSFAPIATIEAAEFHCEAAGFDDETSQASADAAGGHHHHCGHGIAVPDIGLAASARSLAVTQLPALTAVLSSYSQAPPTEPPSA